MQYDILSPTHRPLPSSGCIIQFLQHFSLLCQVMYYIDVSMDWVNIGCNKYEIMYGAAGVTDFGHEKMIHRLWHSHEWKLLDRK